MNRSMQSIQGASRLIFESIEGITNAVERMHETIARHPLPWSQQPQHPTREHGAIAAGVYTIIRESTRIVGAGVDQSMGLVASTAPELSSTSGEIKVVAALNGVCGDHLEATGNPLAIPMALKSNLQDLVLNRQALAAALPQASPHLVVLVHGLSLSELGWNRGGTPDIGSRLQSELGSTPVYVRYNTGRHISTNGQELTQQLEQLCEVWPVPVESVSLIGHSMGGLVIRSACWYAERATSRWLQYLQRVVCLGTPHHGSPVAKAGHALDAAMRRIPYTEPLAFGRRRSAGIKDLRHGDLLDEDWQDPPAGDAKPAMRQAVPLLPNVEYYFAAATLGRDEHDPIGHLIGDLLVRLDSAVGSHQDDIRNLDIKPENCRVFHEKNHFDLLNDERVHRQIIEWFATERNRNDSR